MKILRLIDNEIVTENKSGMSFDYECDVLCVGAGCAGVYAADAAAKNGSKVILLENDISIGGMHVLGNVRGYYYGFKGGSFEEDDEQTEKTQKFHFKVDDKRISMLKRLKKSGVKLLCGCTPTALLTNGNRVVGILAFDGERNISIKAEVTVDSSSDGYLIRMLPINKRYGREYDGKMAPFSVFGTFYDNGGYRSNTFDADFVNQYDSEEFSYKVMTAHEKHTENLKKYEMLNLAAHTGVREGVSFEGEERLNLEELLYRKVPEKVLFWAYSDLDLHGQLQALNDKLFQTWWVICNLATVTVRIPVPWGSVLPKGWKGIATAGRCLSADTYTLSAVRMNRDMFRMGECVGTAASMAAKTEGDFSAVDYDGFVELVKKRDCYYGDREKDFGFDYIFGEKPYKPVTFDFEKNLELLKTETPGVAFWSAFCCDDKQAAGDRIYALLNEAEDDLYRYNLAIALGVMEDKRAIETLREIVKKRDCFYFKDCRRSNQFRSVIAVCLLGRIGDSHDAQLLSEIVFNEEEFSKPLYHTLKPDYLYYPHDDRNFLYFDMFTHAAAAVVKIYLRNGLPTEMLNKEFRRLSEDSTVEQRISISNDKSGIACSEIQILLSKMIELTQS